MIVLLRKREAAVNQMQYQRDSALKRSPSLYVHSERQPSSQKMPEHHPVSSQAEQGVRESRRLILLEKEVTGPGETIAGKRNKDEKPEHLSEQGGGDCDEHAPAADEVKQPVPPVRMLRQVKRVEVTESTISHGCAPFFKGACGNNFVTSCDSIFERLNGNSLLSIRLGELLPAEMRIAMKVSLLTGVPELLPITHCKKAPVTRSNISASLLLLVLNNEAEIEIQIQSHSVCFSNNQAQLANTPT